MNPPDPTRIEIFSLSFESLPDPICDEHWVAWRADDGDGELGTSLGPWTPSSGVIRMYLATRYSYFPFMGLLFFICGAVWLDRYAQMKSEQEMQELLAEGPMAREEVKST